MTPPNKFHCFALVLLVLIAASCNTDIQKVFLAQLATKTDTLQIDNTKDTLVTGPKGTSVFFPGNAFIFPDGSLPKGKISLLLKECYTFSDMIRENLSTTSNNNLLETRGMIYITAASENKELQLRPGSEIIIHFPKTAADSARRMNLYYGNKDIADNINWNIDTQSIIKPSARIAITTWSYGSTSGEYEDVFRLRDDKKKTLSQYFDTNFDNTKLTFGDKLLDKHYRFEFKKAKNGDLINKKIIEVTGNLYAPDTVKNPLIDKYVIDFFNAIPALSPDPEGLEMVEGGIIIDFGYTPTYRDKEEYNSLFNKKYSVFKNAHIKTMNDAELNYFILTSSKLGWINCDYFRESKEEKIDYIVKVDPLSKPTIKLVFKNAKSIMTGLLDGDRYIFKNVPINQPVKIVAISFSDNKPLLSISETTTGRQIFDHFDYREFSLMDLEKELD